MKCPHPKCHSNIGTPLKKYNGEWFCTQCRKPLLPNEQTQFAITLDSHLSLKEADYLYGQEWLLNGNKQARARALQLTSNSAVTNPYALVNLGYYYEVERSDLPELERLHLAYLAYRAVLFNKNPTVQMPMVSPTEKLPNVKHKELLCSAASNLHLLISRIPDSVCPYVIGATTRDKVLAEVVSKMATLGITPLAHSVESMPMVSLAKKVSSAIVKSSGKDFLFALYYLSKQELQELESLLDAPTLNKFFTTNKSTKIVLGDTNDDNLFGEMIVVGNANTLLEHSNVMSTSHVHVFIYNALGKGAKLKPKVYAQILDLLSPNSSLAVDCGEFISNMVFKGLANKYVFTDDDMLIFVDGKFSKSSITKALSLMINGEV